MQNLTIHNNTFFDYNILKKHFSSLFDYPNNRLIYQANKNDETLYYSGFHCTIL